MTSSNGAFSIINIKKLFISLADRSVYGYKNMHTLFFLLLCYQFHIVLQAGDIHFEYV